MCRLVVLLLLLLSSRVLALDCKRACSCPIERCVPANASIFVACPSTPTVVNAQVNFGLYRGEDKDATYKYDFKGSQHKPSDLAAGLSRAARGPDRRVEMHINYTLGAKWARFAITGVTAGDGGLYWCAAKVLHPGAVLTFCNGCTVNLMLQGTHCQAPPTACPTLPSQDPQAQTGLAGLGDWVWVWVGVVAVLVLYAVLMTVVASIKIVRIKKPDFSDNVYMNGKPKTKQTSKRVSTTPPP